MVSPEPSGLSRAMGASVAFGVSACSGSLIAATVPADGHAPAILSVEGLHSRQNGVGVGHGEVKLGSVPLLWFRNRMFRIPRPLLASPVSIRPA